MGKEVLEEVIWRMTYYGDERTDKIHNFIANSPLYKKFNVRELFDQPVETWHVLYLPKVYRQCSNPRCRTERPFDSAENVLAASPTGQPYATTAFRQEPSPELFLREPEGLTFVHSLYYLCTGCGVSEFRCWVETSKEWWRKVGQAPPWDISIAHLEEALGEDAGLYRNALICMSQSYGIGACTYLRRTLENQINPLLETSYEVRQEEGASDEELEGLRKIIEGKTAEEKIRLANQVLPAAITVEGENPLELIYDQLSTGLHRLNEQECMNVAEQAVGALEYVIATLGTERRRRESKQQYKESLRSLRNRR